MKKKSSTPSISIVRSAESPAEALAGQMARKPTGFLAKALMTFQVDEVGREMTIPLPHREKLIESATDRLTVHLEGFLTEEENKRLTKAYGDSMVETVAGILVCTVPRALPGAMKILAEAGENLSSALPRKNLSDALGESLSAPLKDLSESLRAAVLETLRDGRTEDLPEFRARGLEKSMLDSLKGTLTSAKRVRDLSGHMAQAMEGALQQADAQSKRSLAALKSQVGYTGRGLEKKVRHRRDKFRAAVGRNEKLRCLAEDLAIRAGPMAGGSRLFRVLSVLIRCTISNEFFPELLKSQGK